MTEVGWLIEIQLGDRAVWWTGRDMGCGRFWTTESNEAVRFCRKIDADRVIVGQRTRDAVATEHMWIDPENDE